MTTWLVVAQAPLGDAEDQFALWCDWNRLTLPDEAIRIDMIRGEELDVRRYQVDIDVVASSLGGPGSEV